MGTVRLNAPIGCLPAGTACSDVAAEGATCVQEGQVCACEQTLPDDPNDESGTWTVEGTTLTTTTSTASTESVEFCVDGDVMRISSEDAQSGGGTTYTLVRS